MAEDKLTKTERLILMNQYAILEFLTRAHPEFAQIGHVTYHDADTYHRWQSLLQYGYDILVQDITDQVYESSLSRDEQGEVLEILEMYGDLQRSFDALPAEQRFKGSEVDFPGWDGNSSKGELSFARQFCFRGESEFEEQEKPDRFVHVRPSPAHNSHWDWMDAYRRMLDVYRPIREERLRGDFDPMSYEQLRSVLDAMPHPESPSGEEIRRRKESEGVDGPTAE